MMYLMDNSSECSNLPVLNLTNEEDANVYILKDGPGWIMLSVLFVILAIGVSGNLAFLFVVVRVQYMRTTTNVYLCSLATADLMLLISSIVEYNFYFSHPVRSHLSTAMLTGCIGAFMPQYISYFASLSMVTLVSLDRYNCICRPLATVQKGKRVRTRKTIELVLGSWILAVVLAGMIMAKYAQLSTFCVAWPASEMYDDLPTVVGYCGAVGRWGSYIGHLLESMIFIIAMLTNIILYALIILRLQSRVQQRRVQHTPIPSGSQTQQALQVRNQVALMLITNGVVFFLCQTPFVVVSLGLLVHHIAEIPGTETYRKFVFVLTMSHVFVFVNSAVNPIIYNLTSRHYRQAFLQAFSWSGANICRKQDREDQLACQAPP